MVAAFHPSAGQKIKAGSESTRHRTDFDIRKRRITDVIELRCGYTAELGKGAIALGTQRLKVHGAIRCRHRLVDRAGDPHTGIDTADPLAHGDNLTAQITSLNPRKAQRGAPAAAFDLSVTDIVGRS